MMDFLSDLCVFFIGIVFIWFGFKLDKQSYKENRMFISLFSLTGLFPIILSISYYLFRIFSIGFGVILVYLFFTGELS
ncbi:hypothetical protein A9498_31595 (plasmid) [Bacillus thuringiensis serovar coreanensis]|nr:hypothetical protein A9498_29845 [Bacillus thuringiensis serovar coreanensis]ANN35887.1 hypothetical protein A9498_31595 [Bacillus thuringiensis serovar coreanensis]